MGGCVSTRKGFGGNRSKTSKKKVAHHNHHTNNRKKRKMFKKGSVVTEKSFPDRSFISPKVSTGSTEEAWFDSTTRFDSDGEDDFRSVQDDIISQNGPERSRNSHEVNSARNSSDIASNSAEAKHPVSLHELSFSVDENIGKEDRLLDICGIIPNNCMPCLTTTTVDSIEKRRSLVSSPTSAKKKTALKHSLKGKDGQLNSKFSSKMLLQRPKAGSQVLFCPIEKIVMDSWSHVEPRRFRVRGPNYIRDKKKEFAPNYAAYYPFGVDVFLSPRKIGHIARFVELPEVSSSAGFPPILIVNAQIPLYPASFFQSEADGEGISIVMYFKINESFAKELPSNFQESMRRLMHNEDEKVRGFPMETFAPFRERLKILGRLGNVDDLHLSAPEKKLINAYNEKPVLSRPQHDFFSGENYFEIDLDMHRFGYISRKGFEAFFDRLKMCVLDFGLTIQGNKAEELPEQILCCVQLNGIDYTNYQQLGMGEEPFWN